MKRRGFLIISALFVLLVLLALGMGLMSSQSSRYRALTQMVVATQAHELALSGLEDVRSKLELNPDFPPNRAEDQPSFNYAEDVQNPLTMKPIGSYEVVLDFSAQQPPYSIVKVTITGTVGPKESPVAQRTLKAELQRSYSSGVSTLVWRWVNLQDMGGI